MLANSTPGREAGDGAPRWIGPGLLLILATAVVSGVATFLNAYAVQGTNSDAFVTVRNLAVAGLLVPVAILATRTSRPTLRAADMGRLAVIGLIGGAIPFLLFFHGIALATAAGGAATASFGYRTLFLMAGILAFIALRERLNLRWAAAAALLLIGNALLLSLTAPILTDGSLYVLAATALWAGEYTLSKRVLRDVPSSLVGLGRMGFGGIYLAAYLLWTGGWTTAAAFSGTTWAWVGLSALLLLAFVVSWYAGLSRTELSTATSVLVLGFPITWALGLALRGGALGLPQAVGAVLIAIGVVTAIGLAALQATGAGVAHVLGRRSDPPA